MECELWTALSGPADHGNMRPQRSPGRGKRRPGLAVTHGPLMSLWNASLLASEKQRILLWLHLSKGCLAVCLEQQLSGERNSCQGRERSDTLTRRSVYLQHTTPITCQGGGDLSHRTDSLINTHCPWQAHG